MWAFANRNQACPITANFCGCPARPSPGGPFRNFANKGKDESKLKTTAVKGTNDYLPKEVVLRDYLQSTILSVYQSNGFQRIMTPALEDAENLDKSEGGDNLNLIFKILKRGEKLSKSLEAGNYQELSDMGLRYDLTLPLSRYYASQRGKLLTPVKCIQIDKVYRAERPQKGRLREFVQCDIDIIGSSSPSCEMELIAVTAQALLAIGIDDFTVRINDRRLLRGVLLGLGFEPQQLDSVCITFDKLDKIGLDGVQKELTEKEMDPDTISRFGAVLEKGPITLEDVGTLCQDQQAVSELTQIIQVTDQLSGGRYGIEFDLSLVRGQGYYTGTVFEICSNSFRASIAGGGRYDNLIGKFIGEKVPAVGFSIGFERIFSILSESGFQIPNQKRKVAVLYDGADFAAAYGKAAELRSEYDVVLYEKPKKTGKFLGRLEDEGLYGFLLYGQNQEISVFGRENSQV